MQEVEVVGVRIELPSNQPLVLLKEINGERHLPIWIGAPEASAIAFVQQGIVPPRPMTHDLLVNLIHALKREVSLVRLISVEDTVFHAEIVFEDGTAVNSRASDAIAVALRIPCPIYCADQVLDEAGVRIADADDDGEEEQDNAEQEMRQFREFLADVEPEDFER
ncbi:MULTISPECIES: bifunctional nuclease family protein [unclassified Arthrobacter]|uniref:bifunctional nuclease family protein n=1 Tax=unclassified Arthrobacter TaxID=235627 RepID=UPI001D1512D7|nr:MULTISPECIES: bifunctional nuclease family protein [unclassified Arthrobacter]MCC3274294.1 bifunctional nuclease family protein [Arthrobacter sp. zg-Y20]MCC9178113.1 bifunctional nuclease family protein [Arthrobacter sp. zg-Y750]MDK1314450.1 bifunctional nuclease family protein [Arthrobacter sp. zg.Y20]MDK1327336.1 bifunctional nuclease family protein [Arthrobacter sp. zg-Y1143]WIB07438.1 bifunctional nuclease family protein [Arthrobacter sp. zg-Y20]